jgi:hypothetical protein
MTMPPALLQPTGQHIDPKGHMIKPQELVYPCQVTVSWHIPAESLADPEMSFAEELAHNPAYQLPARIKADEITRKVNEEYHGGRPVRNPLSISAAINRYRRRNAGPKAG